MKFNPRTQYRFGGVSLPLDMWAKRLGTTPAVLKRRLREGWSVRKTLSTPIAPEEAREDLRAYSSTGRVVTLFACRGERMSLAKFKKCRVLLAPYLPVRSLKWNYVLKLFEYLQIGRPILASNNPGNVYIAEKYAGRIHLFKSGNATDLAEKLKEML